MLSSSVIRHEGQITLDYYGVYGSICFERKFSLQKECDDYLKILFLSQVFFFEKKSIELERGCVRAEFIEILIYIFLRKN